jgi:hypothetical protein
MGKEVEERINAAGAEEARRERRIGGRGFVGSALAREIARQKTNGPPQKAGPTTAETEASVLDPYTRKLEPKRKV